MVSSQFQCFWMGVIPGEELPWDEIFDDILGSTTETDSAEDLPNTGFSEVFERRISAMKILPFDNPYGHHVITS